MKKILFVFFVILEICCFGILSDKAYALTEYDDKFLVYEVEEDYVIITGYNGNESEVTVPSYIGGKPVYLVSEGAFYNASTVAKINLPDTVMLVEEGAFSPRQTVVYDSNTDNPIVMPPAQPETTKNQSQGSQSKDTAQTDNDEQQTIPSSEKSEDESGIMSTERAEETMENVQSGEDFGIAEGVDIKGDDENETSDSEIQKNPSEVKGTNYSAQRKRTEVPDSTGENKVQLIIIDVAIVAALGLICFLFYKKRKK